MERVGRRTALPAKAITFAGRKKTERMPEGLGEDKAGAAVEPSKNNRRMNRRNGETAKKPLC